MNHLDEENIDTTMCEKEVDLAEKEVELDEQPAFNLGIDDLTQTQEDDTTVGTVSDAHLMTFMDKKVAELGEGKIVTIMGEKEVELLEKEVELGETDVELGETDVELGEKEVELGEKQVELNEQPTFDLGIDDLTPTQEEQSGNNKVEEVDNVIRDLPMLQIAEGTNVGEEKIKEKHNGWGIWQFKHNNNRC